ncbi:MAG: phosphomannomutase/phosphoglucomutase [Clostridia bacterium]|nr:phosphomannomutase/phosphoglucomutase [Clostridia bacterium]
MDWKHFKSGTDIRGVAIDGVAGEPLDMTDEAVSTMARAFAAWLANETGKAASELCISVGRDSRLSGPRLRDAVCAGLTESGVTVYECGLSSTPAMFMSTLDLPCDGAIQLTASHHPFHRNGLKFFRPTGGLEGGDISAILALCEAGDFIDADGGKVIPTDYMPRYAARLRDMICEGVNATDYAHPLDGFHIVVDAGNGAGGFYATEVLAPLGANVEGSQFLDPDGRFPNHIPNPEDADAMRSVCAATVNAGADLGVIFDTDVDRAGCVGADGREINRNRLVALAAAIALENAPAGSTVVTDSVTSDGLKVFIEQTLGGKHCRFKRGYKNVINEAIRLCDAGEFAPLAIETSGHAALKENYFLDDGAYLMTRIIIKAAQLRREGQTLDDLIASLKEPVEGKELRFNIKESDFRTYGTDVLQKLEAFAHENGWAVADDSAEGVRISFGEADGNGWALLRLSVHDPVMPMNIESDEEGGCVVIAQKLRAFMESFDQLDCSKMAAYLDA